MCIRVLCVCKKQKISFNTISYLGTARILITWKVAGLVSKSVWGAKRAHSGMFAFFATCHLSQLGIVPSARVRHRGS